MRGKVRRRGNQDGGSDGGDEAADHLHRRRAHVLRPAIGGQRISAEGYGREALFRTLESALRGESLLQPEIMERGIVKS